MACGASLASSTIALGRGRGRPKDSDPETMSLTILQNVRGQVGGLPMMFEGTEMSSFHLSHHLRLPPLFHSVHPFLQFADGDVLPNEAGPVLRRLHLPVHLAVQS